MMMAAANIETPFPTIIHAQHRIRSVPEQDADQLKL
jgi:hypothetical protein